MGQIGPIRLIRPEESSTSTKSGHEMGNPHVKLGATRLGGAIAFGFFVRYHTRRSPVGVYRRKEGKMASAEDDRRRYPRSRRGLKMTVEDSGPSVLNHVDNISANGVLCHTVKPVPLMTRMRVSLEVPDANKHRIDAEGVVVRCDPDEQGDDHFKVAILFTRLGDEDHKAIHAFVAENPGAEDIV